MECPNRDDVGVRAGPRFCEGDGGEGVEKQE